MKHFLYKLLIVLEKISNVISVLFVLSYIALVYYIMFKLTC